MKKIPAAIAYGFHNITKRTGARLAPGPAWWSIGDLNPWPRHCQCRALPAALMPHGKWFDIKQKFVFYNMYDGHGIHSCMREHERWQPVQTKNLFDETKWWTWRDSNSLPLRCERSALPDELQARVKKRIDCTHRQRQTKMIVNHGVEAGAGEGTWTHTRQEPVPKTGASTNSATPARYALLYHRYGCLSIYMTWNFCLTEGIGVVYHISCYHLVYKKRNRQNGRQTKIILPTECEI